MKIVFVVNDYSFFISHRFPIAKACLDKGWEIHIATPEIDNAREQARKEGFIWHGISMDPGSQNPFKELKSIWGLKKVYNKIQPDLVHHVTVKSVLHGSIAARLAKIPAVVNALSGLGYLYINDNLKNQVIRSVVNKLFRYGFAHPNNRLILQNEDDKEMVLGYRLIDEGKITLIKGSGVNTEKYSYSPEDDSDIRVILPARMLWDKGVGEFVEAAKKLRNDGVEATFHLLGDTDPKNPQSITLDQLNKWNNEYGLFYEGYQKNMIKAFRDANIVCLPSYREGLPKALLEAASVGRAIVTTDAPGCREVVDHGENGYLVPVKDADSMAKKIKELIKDSELRKKFGEKGRKKVVENLSLEKVIEQTVDLYDELFEG